jgi:hypothetical protein
MSLELKTVATFGTTEEAHLASSVLQDAGIESFLEGTNFAGALGLPGSMMCEVKLQVAEEDAQRAEEIIGQEKAVAPNGPATARHCPQCGADIMPGFAVCWSCEQPVDGDE